MSFRQILIMAHNGTTFNEAPKLSLIILNCKYTICGFVTTEYMIYLIQEKVMRFA